MQGNGMNGQWTPEQAAAWQAMQSMTPEQAAQWRAMQAAQAAQGMQLMQSMQTIPGAQTSQWQAVTPEQAAAWQAAQGMQPPAAGAQTQAAAQGMTEAQWAQWQAAQLGMSPEQMMEWQAMQKAKAAAKAKKQRKQQRKAKRSQKSRFTRILQLLAILAILTGGTIFVLSTMRGSQATSALIETGTLGTIYRGDAMIVRNETVYNDEGVQNIDYRAQEGSVVYRGDVVCYVYTTGYSNKEMKALQDYRDQIKDYQQTLLAGETAYDQKMTRLETEVVQRGLEVRSLVQGQRGNLINQESILATAIDERQKYFRSKYSSDMRLNRLFDDEETQQQRIDSWIKQRAATQESIISFYTDGYEVALTPDKFQTYTPAEVRAMFNGQRPEVAASERGKTDIYRLVKKSNYAVLMLIKDSVWTPVEGTTYKLMLEQFANTTVDAQVLSYTRASGELLLRLAVLGDVNPVLYMRTCQAELGEYADGLLVPASALYTQNDQQGVVRINEDGTQVFIPVDVMAKQGDKVFISAIQTGILGTGQRVRLFH